MAFPKYGPQQVDPSALPGVQTATNTSAAAFGAQVGEAVRSESEVLESRGRQQALAAALAKAKQSFSTRLYGDEGLYRKNGKALMESRTGAIDEFDKELADIGGTLSTDRQRQEWELQHSELLTEFRGAVDHRVFTEAPQYETDTLNSALDRSTELAVQRAAHGEVPFKPDGKSVDLSLMQGSLDEQEGLILQYADDHADSLPINKDVWAQTLIEARRSATHAGAIDLIRASGDDRLAKSYFEQVKDELVVKDRERLQQDVRQSSIAGEGQRQASSVFSATWDEQAILDRNGPTMSEMRAAGDAEIDKIPDQEVQDAARSRLDSMVDRAERRVRDTRNEHYDALDSTLMGTQGDLTRVQQDPRWRTLDGKDQENLIKRAKQIAGGDLIVNDDALYYKLVRQATDPVGLGKFADLQLRKASTRLDGQHLDSLISLQSSVRSMLGRAGAEQSEADRKAAEKVFNSARSSWNIQSSYADSISTNLDDKERLNFLNVFDETVVATQVGLGRELNTTEYTTIGQNLTRQFVLDRSWSDPMDDIDEKVYRLNVGDLRIEDVPDEDRNAIRDVLLERGQQVDDVRIRAEYLRGLRSQGVGSR